MTRTPGPWYIKNGGSVYATSAAAEVPTVPSELNQKAIDAGAAALLRLPGNLTALARATAISMAKDEGLDDPRTRMAEACALVIRVAEKEALYHRMGLR